MFWRAKPDQEVLNKYLLSMVMDSEQFLSSWIKNFFMANKLARFDQVKTPNGDFLLCHGSPWNCNEYVYPDSGDSSLNRYKNLEVKWIIQGHTHYPI